MKTPVASTMRWLLSYLIAMTIMLMAPSVHAGEESVTLSKKAFEREVWVQNAIEKSRQDPTIPLYADYLKKLYDRKPNLNAARYIATVDAAKDKLAQQTAPPLHEFDLVTKFVKAVAAESIGLPQWVGG